MAYFYDAKTDVFYNDEVNQITENMIEVSEDDFIHLIDARNRGCLLFIDNNGKIGTTTARPTPSHEWNGQAWIISKEKQAELLIKQRAEIRAQINTKRDECVNGGVFVPEINKWVDTDDKGRSTLVEIKADFDLNGKNNTYTLICADNTAQVIHFDEFKAVWNAVKTLKEKMYENAYMHKVLLEQSENPTDYNWSTGWSKTYQEHLNEQQT
jgi:putative tail fiber assembly protein